LEKNGEREVDKEAEVKDQLVEEILYNICKGRGTMTYQRLWSKGQWVDHQRAAQRCIGQK